MTRKLEIANRGDEPVEIHLPSFPPATLQPGERVTLESEQDALQPVPKHTYPAPARGHEAKRDK